MMLLIELKRWELNLWGLEYNFKWIDKIIKENWGYYCNSYNMEVIYLGELLNLFLIGLNILF